MAIRTSVTIGKVINHAVKPKPYRNGAPTRGKPNEPSGVRDTTSGGSKATSRTEPEAQVGRNHGQGPAPVYGQKHQSQSRHGAGAYPESRMQAEMMEWEKPALNRSFGFFHAMVRY